MFRTDLHHQKSLKLDGSCFKREAVRALIYGDEKVLLIYSPINGDYKLPGGGLEIGENHEEALKREVLEECGLEISKIGEKIALITEYAQAKEPHLDYFQMDSHYYLCRISGNEQREQNLDKYEKELKMIPVWLCPSEALNRNRQILKNNDKPPKWTKRETMFLENILSKK